MNYRFLWYMVAVVFWGCSAIGIFSVGECVAAKRNSLSLAKEHRDWKSSILHNKNIHRFRAHTHSRHTNGPHAVLSFEIFSDSPKYMYLYTFVYLDKALNNTLDYNKKVKTSASVQVDALPPHNTSAYVYFTRGDMFLSFGINSIKDRKRFARELHTGRMLRVKIGKMLRNDIGLNTRGYSLRFSLRGFVEAKERVFSLMEDAGTRSGTAKKYRLFEMFRKEGIGERPAAK